MLTNKYLGIIQRPDLKPVAQVQRAPQVLGLYI